MTSSSHTGTYLKANSGRLNAEGISGRSGDGWRAGREDPNPWIMVDFLRPVTVIGIITQGRAGRDHWVTQYDLAFSDDNITWTNDPIVRETYLIIWEICVTTMEIDVNACEIIIII